MPQQQTNEQLMQRIQKLEERLDEFMLADRLRITRDMEFGTLRGSKIGRTAVQKLSFYGVSPVIQWTSGSGRQDVTANTGAAMNVGCKFDGNTGVTYYSVGDIVAALKAYGFLLV